MPGWLQTLRPFSPLHGLTVVVFGAAIAATIAVGRRGRAQGTEPAFRRALVVFILVWQALAVAWWLLPRNYDPAVSLPLHLCDLVAWIAALALAADIRLARTLLYFWGLGLSSQGFITPVNPAGPADFHYWVFWINHAQIVGAALYAVIVLGYRPRLRDAAAAFIATAAYAAAMIPLNLVTGWNYGYVGPASPESPTLIDALGPWPLRLLPLAAIVAAWFAALWAVWPLAVKLRGHGGAPR